MWHEATCARQLEKHWAVAQVPLNGSNTQLGLLHALADACAQQQSAAVQERPPSPATTATQQHTWNPNPLYRLGSYDPSAPDTQGTITDATTTPHPFSSADTSDAPGPASASTAEAQAAGSRQQVPALQGTQHRTSGLA